MYYAMLLNLFGQRTFDQTSITYNTIWEMCSKLIGANIIEKIDLLEPYQLNPWSKMKALKKSDQKGSDLSGDNALSYKVGQSTLDKGLALYIKMHTWHRLYQKGILVTTYNTGAGRE